MNQNDQDKQAAKRNEGLWWVITILCFCFVWPVGLILLFLKLFKNIPDFSNKKQDRDDARAQQADRPMTQEEINALRAKFRQNAQNGPESQPGQAQYQSRAYTNAGTKTASQSGQVEGAWTAPQQPQSQGHRTSQRTGTQPAGGAGKYNYSYQANYNYGSGSADGPAAAKKKKRARGTGRAARIWGAIMACLGGGAAAIRFMELWTSGAGWGAILRNVNPLMLFCAVGLGLLAYGIQKGRKKRRWTRYLTLLGTRRILDLKQTATATGIRYDRVLADIQEMTDAGEFGAAFVDVSRGMLILDAADYTPPAAPAKEPTPAAAPEMDVAQAAAKAATASDNQVLAQIRAANDAIANPEISEKIDQIGMLTAKIFQLVDENPEKEQEIRSFTAYYLPQTLKILNAYARMEKQGVEGQNITEAKARIETMLDKLVSGYAAQLDRLFGADVLDITSDITVMEAMLAKDGLLEDELQKAQQEQKAFEMEL